MDPITQCPPYHDPTLNWDDHLQELKSMAGGLPIYLKGVCQIEVGLALHCFADDIAIVYPTGVRSWCFG